MGDVGGEEDAGVVVDGADDDAEVVGPEAEAELAFGAGEDDAAEEGEYTT